MTHATHVRSTNMRAVLNLETGDAANASVLLTHTVMHGAKVAGMQARKVKLGKLVCVVPSLCTGRGLMTSASGLRLL